MWGFSEIFLFRDGVTNTNDVSKTLALNSLVYPCRSQLVRQNLITGLKL